VFRDGSVSSSLLKVVHNGPLREWVGNSQIKRRTRVVGLFPNESSLLRLVTGVIIEISEEWETGKIYLQPETKKQQPN
jgi:hypothetical protein